MSDDGENLTVNDLINIWDRLLPPDHYQRILVRALTDMEYDKLKQRALLGSEDGGKTSWKSFLAIGTTPDGSIGFCMYPRAGDGEQIKSRDRLMSVLSTQPGAIITEKEALAKAPDASATIAIACYGRRADGSDFIVLAWRQEISSVDAICHLKLAIKFIRAAEAEVAKGSS